VVLAKIKEDALRRESSRKSKSKLSDTTKTAIARSVGFGKPKSAKSAKSGAKSVLDIFKKRYRLQFGEDLPMVESSASDSAKAKFGATFVFINRAIKNSKDVTEVLRILDFMFDNWPTIKELLGWSGNPTLSLLGTTSYWNRLRAFWSEGLPKKGLLIDSRFDKREAEKEKDVGW
jgi:hypothetical protein